MPAFIDMTGQTYGEWTVLAKDMANGRKWLCRCSCGVEKSVDGANLRNGKSPSCGHLRREKWNARCAAQRDELVGETFGFLTVLRTYQEAGKDARAVCLCACGKEKDTRVQTLLNGMTKSCGCYNSITSKERAEARNDKIAALGQTWTPLQPATCSRCGCTKPGQEFAFYRTENWGRKRKPYCRACDNPKAARATFEAALDKSKETRRTRNETCHD